MIIDRIQDIFPFPQLKEYFYSVLSEPRFCVVQFPALDFIPEKVWTLHDDRQAWMAQVVMHSIFTGYAKKGQTGQ